MSAITKSDVAYVASLAQIEVDEAMQEQLVQELGDILSYVDKLNELDTEGVEPMMHAMEMRNVFREDEVTSSLDRNEALAAAPNHDGAYFLAPKILDSESSA